LIGKEPKNEKEDALDKKLASLDKKAKQITSDEEKELEKSKALDREEAELKA
jgi:hypothetical protein